MKLFKVKMMLLNVKFWRIIWDNCWIKDYVNYVVKIILIGIESL